MTYVMFFKFSWIRKTINHSCHCSPKIEKYYKYNFDLVCAHFQGWIWVASGLSKYFEYCTNFERPEHSVLLCDVDRGTTPPTPHYKAAVIPPNIISSSARDVFFVKWQIDSIRPAYCAVCKSNTWKQVLKKMRLPMQRHTAEPELMNFLVLV